MAYDLITIENSPHPEVLTQVAQAVTFPLSEEEIEIIAAMKRMAISLKGVGLAAPQIGIAKQIIVYHVSEEVTVLRKDAHEIVPLTVLIKPSYTPAPDANLVYDWEACFSVTQTMGKVPRYDQINYTAQTE